MCFVMLTDPVLSCVRLQPVHAVSSAAEPFLLNLRLRMTQAADERKAVANQSAMRVQICFLAHPPCFDLYPYRDASSSSTFSAFVADSAALFSVPLCVSYLTSWCRPHPHQQPKQSCIPPTFSFPVSPSNSVHPTTPTNSLTDDDPTLQTQHSSFNAKPL